MASVKLTKSLIEKTASAVKDVYLWDTEVKGLVCKVTPKGKRVFLLEYRPINGGSKRKPKIGDFGKITLDQARRAAREMLADVAKGRDPSADRKRARSAPTVDQLCDRFLREYAELRSSPKYLKQQRRIIERKIKPVLGSFKIAEVAPDDAIPPHNSMQKTPREANHVIAILGKIMNEAEVWGLRSQGFNPCKHIKKFKERRRERLLSDDEVRDIHKAMNEIEIEQSEHRNVILSVRLLFATGARVGEILGLRWEWLDWEARQIRWPDAKAGPMSKPLTSDVAALLTGANNDSEYVVHALKDSSKPLSYYTLEKAFRRVLKRAGVSNATIHSIRHRVVTDIANAGIPINQGMALTGHKTVTTFMRYVHNEDEPVRAAAERVAKKRRAVVEGEPLGDVVSLSRGS